MAANATESGEQVDKLSIRVLVDKENNKVVFAEAGKDFVDALFSFLTLPLGTIARLVANKSSMQSVNIGSLSSLYQSVVDLNDEYLRSQTCKEMLLHPRNSMEAYCHKMKLNIDDTPLYYFFCKEWICNRKKTGSLLSTFRNQKCVCGKVMDNVVSPDMLCLENGFVEETASFIISDDLHVIPNALGASIHLLQKLGVHNIDTIEERIVHISKIEVIDLLMLAMLSKTPLTDLILNEKQFNSRNQSEFEIGEIPTSEFEFEGKVSMKITMRKSTGEILFAEGEPDFADLLLSFLTFPMGGVLNMLEASSSVSCMDNLYKSLNDLSPHIFLKSQELKDKLTKPQCFPNFELKNQILPIGIAELPVYYCHTYFDRFYGKLIKFTKEKIPSLKEQEWFAPFELADPKFCISKSSISGEFVKGPSLYMVTDDLIVTPISSVSALSYLNKSKVPLFDLEERVIIIGLKEGLNLLKASLISKSALTTGLKQFTKNVKEEK